jgi:hypothetical protein
VLTPPRLAIVFAVNKVVFAERDAVGAWQVIRSSDADLGGHLLDPTGTGELTADRRLRWAAELEAHLFAAAVATSADRPIAMPRDLPAYAHRLALREQRASTWAELRQLRRATGDPTVLPFARYVQVETGGRSGSPVALGHHPDPATWPSLDFKLSGESVRIDVLGPDGFPRYAAGHKDATRHVLGHTVADHLATWLSTIDPSMTGPRRGLRRPKNVLTDPSLVRYVGRSVDDLESTSVRAILEFKATEGWRGLQRRGLAVGASEIARLGGLSERTASDVLHGHAEPGPETMAKIADAVARAAPRTCPSCGKDYYGPPQKTTCSPTCRQRRHRARLRASISESVGALRQLGGAVPADRTWDERDPSWVEVAAPEEGR